MQRGRSPGAPAESGVFLPSILAATQYLASCDAPSGHILWSSCSFQKEALFSGTVSAVLHLSWLFIAAFLYSFFKIIEIAVVWGFVEDFVLVCLVCSCSFGYFVSRCSFFSIKVRVEHGWVISP